MKTVRLSNSRMEVPVDDKACNEADRLAVYGLQSKQPFDQPLTIPPDTRMRLSAERVKEDHPALARLQPKTIDDVKKWIGVPDELGAKRACGCKLPAALPGVGSARELRQLDPNVLRALHEVADEYVHGDSRRVAAFKPILDYLVDRSWINIILLRPDIDIYGGAVLTVASNIKVLWAGNIRIWRGGLLKITGNTKIDCLSITGDHTTSIIQLVDTAVFGDLLIKEA
jgi:hypothetical protein